MPDSELQIAYTNLKAQAELLAGGLGDIQRRVAILTSLYLDSGRNHVFSQIAAHGALWAMGYFEAGGSLGRLVARRYFYNAEERGYRLGILREFSESFRRVNRLVCVDTYTNYHFSKTYGHISGADTVIPVDLLDALNRVHHARARNTDLTPPEKRQIFECSFHCEQEITVAPGVAAAVAEFDCPIMRVLCLHPIVRFAYFPKLRYLLFRDFSNTEERISKGMRAYDLADRVGWDQVHKSMRYYGQMPESFFAAPLDHYQQLRSEIIRTAQAAAQFREPD